MADSSIEPTKWTITALIYHRYRSKSTSHAQKTLNPEITTVTNEEDEMERTQYRSRRREWSHLQWVGRLPSLLSLSSLSLFVVSLRGLTSAVNENGRETMCVIGQRGAKHVIFQHKWRAEQTFHAKPWTTLHERQGGRCRWVIRPEAGFGAQIRPGQIWNQASNCHPKPGFDRPKSGLSQIRPLRPHPNKLKMF